MKKALLTLVAIVAVAFTASAQKQGEQHIGANLGYNTGKTNVTLSLRGDNYSEKESILGGDNLGVGVEYGYFVIDNLRVGGRIGYSYTANGDKSHSLTIMPNIAYYVRLADKFYYTPNFAIGFGLGTTGKDEYTNESLYDVWSCNGAFSPWPEFRPTEKFAMSVSLCSLQYVFLTGDIGQIKVDTGAFSFDLLANAQVGFKLYF